MQIMCKLSLHCSVKTKKKKKKKKTNRVVKFLAITFKKWSTENFHKAKIRNSEYKLGCMLNSKWLLQ